MGWFAVSEYSRLHDRIEVAIPDRRFDQPGGWIAIGHLDLLAPPFSTLKHIE